MRLHHPQLQEMAHELYALSGDVFYKRQGRMLVIYGENGSGKTHAARCFHKWFNLVRLKIGPVLTTDQEGHSQAQIPDSCLVNWPQIVDGFKQDQWLIVERLTSDYLVVIDDIGAEHDPSRIGIEKLYVILSRRELKFTIVTTNIPPEKWESAFERRISSRLYRNSTDIDLSQVPDWSSVKHQFENAVAPDI